jgi:glycosyltransferase involved in cell wall biosynthesis
MLGLEIISSPTVGALSEPWMELKGKELISKLKLKKQEIIDKVYKLLSRDFIDFESINKPKVSIITSVFDGDKFIGPFLKDITSQTYFSNCELVLVDCNSPGNERQVIESYAELHENIKYIKLQEDPGVYGAWNEAIRQSTGEFITNANLDDRRCTLHIEELVRTALAYKDCDLFYSPCLVTNEENETYNENSSQGQVYPTYEFTREGMVKCLPGPMPLWKRDLHDKHGYFDESYKSAGDWEMWLRFVAGGSKFKLTPTVLGLYYHNPFGLSTSVDNKNNKLVEEKKVFRKYRNLFSKNLPENIERYFDG